MNKIKEVLNFELLISYPWDASRINSKTFCFVLFCFKLSWTLVSALVVADFTCTPVYCVMIFTFGLSVRFYILLGKLPNFMWFKWSPVCFTGAYYMVVNCNPER